MITNYPIGDFFIRLKNASMAKQKEVVVPNTKLLLAVANVLKEAKYLSEVSVAGNTLTAKLAYKSKKPILMNVKLVSKLGLRIYQNTDQIAAHRGSSTLILSTPKGILTSRHALKEKVGGEVLAEIW